MADNQKYYYMKLKADYFNSKEQILMEKMQDGYLYSNILLKLYLLALEGNGKLMFTDLIPYNAEMIATLTRHQVGTVEKALQLFEQLKLIERFETGEIYMMDMQSLIGSTSTEADRKKAYRERIKERTDELLLPNGQMSGQTSDKRPPDIRDKNSETRDKNSETRDKRLEPKQEIDSCSDRCTETVKNDRSVPKKTPSSFSIILNDGSFYNVSQEDIDEYKRLYPNVNVEQSLRNMAGWSNANTTRRKTIRGVKRFISAWLMREQDSGKSSKKTPARDLEYPDEDDIY